jgi:preprotein translocase subunit SecG
MIYLLVVLHIIVCLFLIGVVLLQQGKSADLAGAFGGQGSQTILFMLTSIGLTVLMARSSSTSVFSGEKAPVSAPAKK